MDYRIHLEAFEGPLDLLLHLIKKEDIDIYNIPIARLLDQYIEYINLAKELDIDLAGEFLEMAAELTYIKSRMLLPESSADEDEGPDPRADLVAKLLEYQRYKMAAQALLRRPMLGRDVFIRPTTTETGEAQEMFVEADTLALLSAFQKLLKKMPPDQVHEIQRTQKGVAERVLELTEFLRGRKQIAFEDLFEGGRSRSDIVGTFLAILEMAKQGLVKIIQERVHIFVASLITENTETLGVTDGT